MSFPANVQMWTACNRPILSQDVRKGTVLAHPDGRVSTVVCVVVSHAEKPFVGALTPQQGAVIARRATRLQCPYVGADLAGAGADLAGAHIRFDFLIDDRCAAVVANGEYAVAWDPTFVLNAKVQLLPGFEAGAVFYG